MQNFAPVPVNFKGTNEQIRKIYWRAEQLYRKYTQNIIISCVAYDQFGYVLTFFYSIYCLCIGNYDASTWVPLLQMSIPFDTKTIYGWYLLLFMLICTDIAYLSCLILGTTHFVGCCMYIMAICEHFDVAMQTVQATIEQSKRAMEINRQMHKAIRIHVKINE